MQSTHSTTKLTQLKAKQQQLQEKLSQKLLQLGGCGGMARLPADRLVLANTIDVFQARLNNLQSEIQEIEKKRLKISRIINTI